MHSVAHAVGGKAHMATDYARMKDQDLHALYKKSCAQFRELSEEITAMRTVLDGRRQIASAKATIATAEAQIAAAQKAEG